MKWLSIDNMYVYIWVLDFIYWLYTQYAEQVKQLKK